jgi:hypothetical protein
MVNNHNEQIKDLFDHHCGHLVFDKKMLSRAIAMQESFVNKNHTHVVFFGGSNTGVEKVRFTDADRDLLFDTILEVDEDLIESQLHSLKDKYGQNVVDQTHVRGSDVFNNASVYAIYRFHTSTHLSEEERLEGKKRVCSFLIYKFLTSLLYWYFKYPADPEIAEATYAALSLKFSLRQYGSWGLTIMNLAEKMAGPESTHQSTISKMDDDKKVEKYINDVQSRIKDMLKNIYEVFMNVHSNGGRITSSSNFSEIEGEIELKDKTQSLAVYSRYLKSIIPDKNAFIQDELIAVVIDTMNTVPPRLFKQTLEWTSEHYLTANGRTIEQAVDVVMEHAIYYLSDKTESGRNDLGKMILALKGTYMSSRSTDARLINARNIVEEIVRLATKSVNSNSIAAVRTAWMLYLVSRAYAMKYYASR